MLVTFNDFFARLGESPNICINIRFIEIMVTELYVRDCMSVEKNQWKILHWTFSENGWLTEHSGRSFIWMEISSPAN